ncbi:MAG: type II secretion system F family protein [Reyranella sp.]|nr:type II secretion system F family protein [Reyranella sp.]
MDLASTEKSFVVMVAAATFVAFWAIWLAITWEPPIEARLRALRTRRMKARSEQGAAAAKASTKETSLGLMRQIADRLNLLRGSAADQTTRKLRRAGFLSRDASVVYVFIKLALPLALGFLMTLLASSGLLGVPEDMNLLVGMGAVLSGFIMPEVYLKNVSARRRETLNYVLPEGLDLLTICVEAGLSIDAAFRRVAKEMQSSMPELAAEFEQTAIELTYLPDRQQALENMAERSDSPSVAALVNALRQTEKYGTPLANSLRILSQEFRQTRVSKAEEKGARMPALMTVPLMVFILPTLITVLIAPAILQVINLT